MVGVAAGFLIALGWSVVSIWLGPRVGLVDSPAASSLKVHERPTPLLGGVGVFAGIHVGMLIEGVFDPILFAATLAVLGLGLTDDAMTLSPKIRLGVELVVSVLLVVMIASEDDSILWIVGGVVLVLVAINAVNLFDGLDGLVGSVTVVAGLGLAWAGTYGFGETALGLVIAGSVAGFLIMNWQPARLFLGDNGAYLIGTVLAYGVLVGGKGDIGDTLLLTVAALGVFLIDLVATIARRIRNRTPVFQGDRSHIYDRLRDRGLTMWMIALLAAGTQAILAVLAVSLMK